MSAPAALSCLALAAIARVSDGCSARDRADSQALDAAAELGEVGVAGDQGRYEAVQQVRIPHLSHGDGSEYS